MELLVKNAIDAFECGVEDFTVGTDARLKSSLRNAYAAVLLLFKESLRELSPLDSNELLVKKNVVPKIVDGKIVFHGKGESTVDFHTIKSRFEELQIHVNWDDLKDVRRIRNDAEHYYTEESKRTIEEALSKLFNVAVEFIRKEFEDDPKDYFSDSAWDTLIDIEGVFKQEKTMCLASYGNFSCDSAAIREWLPKYSCNSCGSSLIHIEECGGGICRSCETDWNNEDLSLAIALQLSESQSPFAVYEGHDPLVVDCPFCTNHSLIVEEVECFCCGESPATECSFCSNGIPVSEWSDESMCSWCIHKFSKDD